ncbi:thiamine pyrophosphate-dependent dehydrogenase E1 component subunit alpha [Ramlibacter rhizophilus]|uniref:Thiamine pyrophosphate-dependent dehydrogenase E1 component subunit alpha n=1 Tax=Ramlibacter rhizophilus TaxID=1781167 RepID=A0A4Z0BVS1_9BURK|nr:thiamine pyrophosphate-dependent dehydrogenase E1 component subunit alpha [Ramlibacter rhizophilus]TFZ03416.1 thiamine pyrophosphate-dependent dehydrogenase E1 component subunit alpha [Ramlibacter rhizophilus]
MENDAHAARRVRMLERMLLIRAYEEKLAELHATQGLPGTCTSVGQEACAVGVVQALQPEDRILTNHRSGGHLLARGADAGRMMAEVMGRSTGYCRGKSGSLHVSVKELGVVLTSTIVGGELSLATGVGLSMSMLAQDGIAACFFGDGAACEGRFHESLNLAAVWKLPVLYVCENNQWQAFVHRRETMLTDSIATWAERYGMPSRSIDGNDVEAVAAAAEEARAHMLREGGPYFLELNTYRLRGHFEPDDQSYVDKDELAAARARDPIVLMQRRLQDEALLGAQDWTRLQAQVAVRIEQALAFASASPFPDASELTTDVYA